VAPDCQPFAPARSGPHEETDHREQRDDASEDDSSIGFLSARADRALRPWAYSDRKSWKLVLLGMTALPCVRSAIATDRQAGQLDPINLA